VPHKVPGPTTRLVPSPGTISNRKRLHTKVGNRFKRRNVQKAGEEGPSKLQEQQNKKEEEEEEAKMQLNLKPSLQT
jgi:hypothetical protein